MLFEFVSFTIFPSDRTLVPVANNKNDGETLREVPTLPVSLSLYAVVSHTNKSAKSLNSTASSSSPLKWTEILMQLAFSPLKRTSAMSKGINSLADSLAGEWIKEVMRRRLTENQLLVLFKVFHEITGDRIFAIVAARPFLKKQSPKSYNETLRMASPPS